MPQPSGFSVSEGEEVYIRTPSIRLQNDAGLLSGGGGGSGGGSDGGGAGTPAAAPLPAALLAHTLSEEMADDAIAGRHSGGGRRVAYAMCCATPSVYRTDNSLPVERLNALIDALLPIVGTVMFVKYFTNVGEVEEEIASERCTEEHASPCTSEMKACPDSAAALYITTTALACAGTAVSLLVLACRRAPDRTAAGEEAARTQELMRALLLTALICGGFTVSCLSAGQQSPHEPVFCGIVLAWSALCAARVSYIRRGPAYACWRRVTAAHGEDEQQARKPHFSLLCVCIVVFAVAAIDLVAYAGAMIGGDEAARMSECAEDHDPCSWLFIFELMWIGHVGGYEKLIRLSCTSALFAIVCGDWAANVRLFRYVETVASGRISNTAYCWQCVWILAVTLYPLTMAPFVMGWKTRMSFLLTSGQLSFSSFMHMLLAMTLPSPGPEVRNALISENFIVWATMFSLWVWVYLQTDEEIHRHRHWYFIGGPFFYGGSFCVCKAVFKAMERNPPQAELEGLVRSRWYKGRGWKLTPVTVPLERLGRFFDGVFVITMMLVLVELSSMASQELLTMSRVSTPHCDDPLSSEYRPTNCREPESEDWEGADSTGRTSDWFPSFALDEACANIAVGYHDGDHGHDEHHEAEESRHPTHKPSLLDEPPSPPHHTDTGSRQCDLVKCGSSGTVFPSGVPWCVCNSTELKEGRNPCVAVSYNVHQNGSFYKGVLDKYWDENGSKAWTHVTTLLILSTWWFLHHVVFLAPHEGDYAEGSEGEEHDSGRAEADQPATEHAVAPGQSARVSYNPQVENLASLRSLRQMSLTMTQDVMDDTAREQEHNEAGLKLLIINMTAMVCVGLVPYCIDTAVQWNHLRHASTLPIFCVGFIQLIYCACLLTTLYLIHASDASKDRAKSWLAMGFLAAALLVLAAVLIDGGTNWPLWLVWICSPLPLLLHAPLQLSMASIGARAGQCVFR